MGNNKSHKYKVKGFNRSPKVLSDKDIPSIAKYIQSSKCKRIVLMLGAGISTSAGIPDFRSPETGLYSNLARLNLPHPEAVFDIGFFRHNPTPFYTLAHELYPGKFRPTISHSFIRLLAAHSLLHICFTQNIDTLERLAGVPDDKIIEAHGSFASQRCIECLAPYDTDKMKAKIEQKQIARCESCNGLVKPDIVFFGEALPPKFLRSVGAVGQANLLIIMGTSLTVHPFASLAGMANDNCPRILINLDQVGDIGRRSDDVVLLGKCDDVVTDLCKELGWYDELLKLWQETEGLDTKESEDQQTTDADVKPLEEEPENEVERVQGEVELLIAAIAERLALDNPTLDEPDANSDPVAEKSLPKEPDAIVEQPSSKSPITSSASQSLQDTTASPLPEGSPSLPNKPSPNIHDASGRSTSPVTQNDTSQNEAEVKQSGSSPVVGQKL